MSARAEDQNDVKILVPMLVVGTCKNLQTSPLSRYWELEPASNCGTFGIRGYKPISLAVVASDNVNLWQRMPRRWGHR